MGRRVETGLGHRVAFRYGVRVWPWDLGFRSAAYRFQVEGTSLGQGNAPKP